jgi:RNA polymerase-binding transcription factor DksA
MAKNPGKRQRTDAGRIGEKGTGKPPGRTAGTPEPQACTEAAEAAAETIDEIRQRLERERAATIEELRRQGAALDTGEVGTVTRAGSVLDEGDQAQVSLGDDMSMMRRERLAARVNQLTAALERVARGGYGRCDVCGRPIEAGRLAALPEARTCRECQERIEQGRQESAA